MYLVVEWITTSAPRANGCCRYGEANVLSTTHHAFAWCAICATAATSTIFSSGLVGVSAQTTFVSGRTAFRTAERSVRSTVSNAIPIESVNTRASSR